MSTEIKGVKSSRLEMPNGYYDDTSYNLIFKLIVAANPQINFTSDQVRLSDIKPKVNNLDKTNTVGKLVGIPEMGREGEFDLNWNRCNLSDVFRDVHANVPHDPNAMMISDYLPAFNARWGFRLGSGDIYDEPVYISDLDKRVRIRFRESCPAFHGSFYLVIGDENLSINSILIEPNCVGLHMFNGDKAINGPMYNWGRDYSSNYVRLAGFSNGTNIVGEVAEYFNKLLPNDWKETITPEDFNFNGAYVYYNGTTKAAPVPSNKDYQYVLVILLSNTMCANVSGHLVFHYNGIE